MANRNRTAGNTYELEIVKRYNSFDYTNEEGVKSPLFPTIGTTRELSRAMDSKKVDITTVKPKEYEEFGLTIQAKNKTTAPSYPKLLDQMKEAVEIFGGIPIVYHKQTQRVQKTQGVKPRFMKRGEFVVLNATDFELIYTKLRLYEKVYEEFLKYFDSFDGDIQKKLDMFLKGNNL